MKISELIAKLEEVKQEHGDLPVHIGDDVDTENDYAMEGIVEVRDEIDRQIAEWVEPWPKRVALL